MHREATQQVAERKAAEQWWDQPDPYKHGLLRYHRLWLVAVIAGTLVSLVPLGVMFFINYYQYRKALAEEVQHPIRLAVNSGQQSLSFFLEERKAALNYIVRAHSFEELTDQKELTSIFQNVQRNYSGFVDIGVIDASGVQRAYVGPFDLQGKDYRSYDWFKYALLRGVHVSDVFLGYRHFPHFAIAVRNENERGRPFVLRATMNAAIFERLIQSTAPPRLSDTFVANKKGVLQTPSRTFGEILAPVPLELPSSQVSTLIREEQGSDGVVRVVGYAVIEDAPFIFVTMETREGMLRSWLSLRNKLLWLFVVSVISILLVIFAGARYMVRRIRESDDKRLMLLHNMEYTSKMASIGRLAAGVAHEINNPLAIIGEKAGLLKDYITLSDDDDEEKEKHLRHVEPILSSVERCARITRRLLGFAKHMDLRLEPINIETLLREVLGFLEKESSYRQIKVSIMVDPDTPVIESDRGRLQQVFLNIVNNGFGAVSDGGRIDIQAGRRGLRNICVTIRDNGVGIPKENLPHIFEPFFTTKEKHGTGLGLSITYGIVTKLGGSISVDSQVGEGTEFTVVLPTKPDMVGEQQ